VLKRIKIRPNYLIPFTSTTIVMLILGLIGAAYIFSGELVNWLKETTDIAVEIRDGSTSDQLSEVMDFLETDERILEGSIVHLPPEEALKVLGMDVTGSDWWEDDKSPFRDMVIFNVKADWFTPAELSKIRRNFKEKSSLIEEIHYQDRLVLDFHSNLENLAWWFAGFGLLFLMLSIILIYNTTKLALYADRREIETMELVGASRGFIRRPYLLKSFFLGTISGVIALGAIGGIIYLAYDNPLTVIQGSDLENIIFLVGGLLLGAGIFSFLCTWLTLNQYLNSGR